MSRSKCPFKYGDSCRLMIAAFECVGESVCPIMKK